MKCDDSDLVSNRGERNRPLVPRAAVGAAFVEQSELSVKHLAAQVPELPAGGRSRRGHAEESLAAAAVDHTGETHSCLKMH